MHMYACLSEQEETWLPIFLKCNKSRPIVTEALCKPTAILHMTPLGVPWIAKILKVPLTKKLL